MDFTSSQLSYEQVAYFSKIVLDYIGGSLEIQPFYKYPVSLEGIRQAIDARKQFNNNRRVLVEELQQQYQLVPPVALVQQHIADLLDENTFTIVTAHQPNIFTGHLYFIYKILHTIKLAAFLREQFPEYKFVPVFYIGSEDADLEELGNIHLNGEKLVWETSQVGAVGRMSTKGLDKIIDRLDDELSVLPYGTQVTEMLRRCYLDSPDVQTATFKLAHELFADFGLVVLLPDNAALKSLMRSLFEDDLLTQTASSIMEKTNEKLSKNYKVQAAGREINLFYLKDDIRERIVKSGEVWRVVGTSLQFSQPELLRELDEYPERFSPNVILRSLYQETILPNIAFIGGSGEIAYWLEFRDLFEHYQVPLPVLILRNSFVFIDKKMGLRIDKLGLALPDIFKSKQALIEGIVKKNSDKQLDLDREIGRLETIYEETKMIATTIDPTLNRHVEALAVEAKKKLRDLEKKMMRKEKLKFESQQRQLDVIKDRLFPHNGLQERVDNFSPYYAAYGPAFFTLLYDQSLTLEQQFVMIREM